MESARVTRMDESDLTNVPTMDWEKGLDRLRGNRQALIELLRFFFAAERSGAIADAAKRGSLHDAAFDAHAMKGSAANLGLERIALCAAGVERAARAADVHGMIEYAERLQAIVAQAREAVRP